MFYLLIVLALALIIGTAFYAGRKSSRAAVNINRIFLEELSPEVLTDEQRAVYDAYHTLLKLQQDKDDPTWEAFLLALHGQLNLPHTVTHDHLRGGEDIEVVLDLVADSFPRRSAATIAA